MSREARAKAIVEEAQANGWNRMGAGGTDSISADEEAEIRHWKIERFTAAIELDCECVEAYVARGTELYFDGQDVDAAADMRRALALRPTDPSLYSSMACPFDGAQAREILQTGMAIAEPLSHEHRELREKYIRTYWYEGEFQRYVRLLEEWLPQLSPNDYSYSHALQGLARGFSALGQHEKAELAYRTALGTTTTATEDGIGSMIVQTWMHREHYQEARMALAELEDAIESGERMLLDAVLTVLAAPGTAAANQVSTLILSEAEAFVGGTTDITGSTNYYSFLLGVLYMGAGRMAEARQLLLRFADESSVNPTEWGVTLRWEIAKARELAHNLRDAANN